MSHPSVSVSVIIPCYNAAAFVRDAVASVLAQTYPIHEIICVDDGSTDATLDVLHGLAAESSIPFHVLTKPNGGPASTRSWGTGVATGDYLQYLDADDLLEPEKIEHQVALVEASETPPDLIAAAYQYVRFDDGIAGNTIDVDPDPWRGLMRARIGITSANLWRRSAVSEAGGWDENAGLSEDVELVFRMLKDGAKVVVDPVCLTTLRRRNDSWWNADARASLEAWCRLRKDVLAYLRDARGLTAERERELALPLFTHLRRLYELDPPLAIRIHGDSIKQTPDLHHADFGRVYSLMYRSVGFGLTEALYKAKRQARKRAGYVARRIRRLFSQPLSTCLGNSDS